MHLQTHKITRPVALALSVMMIVGGGILAFWLLANFPRSGQDVEAVTPDTTDLALSSTLTSTTSFSATAGTQATGALTLTGGSTTTGSTLLTPTITVTVGAGVPGLILQENALAGATNVMTMTNIDATAAEAAPGILHFDLNQTAADGSYQYTFVAATRFDSIGVTLTQTSLQRAWVGESPQFAAVAVLSETLPLLSQLLDEPGTTVQGYATQAEVVAAAWGETPTLVLLPFDQLAPRLLVLPLDGQNPIENSNKFDAKRYPLVASIYAHITADHEPVQQAAQRLLDALPLGNRDPDRLTVIAMTGVTAMVRLTAAEMDKRGYGWPAEVVGPELAAADITAISNEVPFVPGCETDTRMENLTFCSKPEYMETLTASGVDIIGLTGNHQNDYGRTDAVTSLDIYEAAGLPVYGGGRNKEEAFAPLYLEHNGNRLAFLGANSYGPRFAWATDDAPGSAEFDLNIMSATVRNIKELDRAAVVLVEFQYQESYNPTPLLDQRQNFNAVVRAGADIVTGVQSHVPQGMEFTDGKLVLYGLGNLYFDQMWSQATREGLIVKHTIYNNRHLSTQIFTTILYDYGQPRWTTPTENEAILQRVFGASYW